MDRPSRVASPRKPRQFLEVIPKESVIKRKKYREVLVSADTVTHVLTSWLWATRVIEKDEYVFDVIPQGGSYMVRLETE